MPKSSKKRKKAATSETSPAPSPGEKSILESNAEYRTRLINVVRRLQKLVLPFIQRAIGTQASSDTGTGTAFDQKSDEKFSSFLANVEERGSGDVDRLDVEDAILWSRLSFFNEIVVNDLQRCAIDDSSNASNTEEQAQEKFKKKFVDTFTKAFADDLSTLQHDKILQELGAASVSSENPCCVVIWTNIVKLLSCFPCCYLATACEGEPRSWTGVACSCARDRALNVYQITT